MQHILARTTHLIYAATFCIAVCVVVPYFATGQESAVQKSKVDVANSIRVKASNMTAQDAAVWDSATLTGEFFDGEEFLSELNLTQASLRPIRGGVVFVGTLKFGDKKPPRGLYSFSYHTLMSNSFCVEILGDGSTEIVALLRPTHIFLKPPMLHRSEFTGRTISVTRIGDRK